MTTVDLDLVRKYDVSAPRYTFYPCRGIQGCTTVVTLNQKATTPISILLDSAVKNAEHAE